MPSTGCSRMLDGVLTSCDLIDRLFNGGGIQLERRNANGTTERLPMDSMLGVSRIWHPAKSGNSSMEIDCSSGKCIARTNNMVAGYWEFIQIGLQGLNLASQNPVQLTETQVDTLRANLQKLLDDPDCGKFINAMIGRLPNDAWKTNKYSGSLMDAFDRINNGGGFWSGDTGPKALAKTDPNTLTTTFDTRRQTPYITGESWQQLGVTFTLVHELTHVFTNSPNAGVYGHLPMAQAASAAAASLGLDIKEVLKLDFPTTQKYGTGEAYDLALSAYFGRTLSYACRKVKL